MESFPKEHLFGTYKDFGNLSELVHMTLWLLKNGEHSAAKALVKRSEVGHLTPSFREFRSCLAEKGTAHS
eukprot:1995229-Amphidinium_carterae.1